MSKARSSSMEKVQTNWDHISILNEPRSFFYQEVKISLLSLFIGLRESKTFEDQALAQGSNQKRLLNFYKELAIASLRCTCHR